MWHLNVSHGGCAQHWRNDFFKRSIDAQRGAEAPLATVQHNASLFGGILHAGNGSGGEVGVVSHGSEGSWFGTGGSGAEANYQESTDFALDNDALDMDDHAGPAEDDGNVASADDAEWESLKLGLCQKLLAAGGKAQTTGRLAYELQAKKRPVAAALFELLEAGAVGRLDEVPPKWTLAPGVSAEAIGSAPDVAQGSFAYDAARSAAKRKRADTQGQAPVKSSHGDFEELKLFVRRSVASKGGTGITAGALGYEVGANRKALNAALYACEKDGTVWSLGDKETGQKIRWAALEPPASAGGHALPACFAYSGVGGRDALTTGDNSAAMAHAVGSHLSQKRPRTNKCADVGDPFETMKLLVHRHVAATGEQGVTAGALGHELGAKRPPVNAALYACLEAGLVKQTEGQKPRWVSTHPPSAEAAFCHLPAKFAYDTGAPVSPSVGASQERWPPVGASSTAAWSSPAAGTVASQQIPVAKGGCVGNDVARLNEWAQKGVQDLRFVDVGQESGNFVCRVTVNGQTYATERARNKKDAKKLAAATAAAALGV